MRELVADADRAERMARHPMPAVHAMGARIARRNADRRAACLAEIARHHESHRAEMAAVAGED